MILHRYKIFENLDIESNFNNDTVKKLKYLVKVGAIKSYTFDAGFLTIIFYDDTKAQYEYDTKYKFKITNNTVGKNLKLIWNKFKNDAKNSLIDVDFDQLHGMTEYLILLDFFTDVTTSRMDNGTIVLMHINFRKKIYDYGYKINPKGFIAKKYYMLDNWQEKSLFMPPIFDLKGCKEAFIVIMHDIIRTDNYLIRHDDYKSIENIVEWSEFVAKVKEHLKKIGRSDSEFGLYTPGTWAI